MTTSLFRAACITTGLLLTTVTAFAQDATATLRLASLFTDHMVLQRDQENPVWGRAEAGSEVTVKFDGETFTTTTAENGRWQIDLSPRKAGGPHTLQVTAGAASVTCNDVLVGEVWVASGQSNMNWQVVKSADPGTVIAAANHPNIRLYTVPRTPSLDPLEFVDGDPEWEVCTPDNVSTFSAVAYHFGKSLHESLDIPIGLIHTSVGGTKAELWTSPEGLRKFDDFADEAAKLDKLLADKEATRARYREDLKAWHAELEKLDQVTTGSGEPAWWDPASNAKDWKEAKVPGLWKSDDLASFDGTVRYRREFTLGDFDEESSYVLRLGRIDDADTTWLNGELIDSTDDAGARRAYQVPAGVLRKGKNVLAVRVLDTGAEGGFVGPAGQMVLSEQTRDEGTTTAVRLAGTWKYQVGKSLASETNASGLPPRPPDPFPAYHIGSLYKGMVAPLVPYGVRGFIWYQGEGNAGQYEQYKRLFPHMITDWRRVWGGKDLPFYFVQLAGYMDDDAEPGDPAWARQREAQLEALKLPNTGVAVTIDIGDDRDIHPKNKKDVGERLARIARSQVYGEEVEFSGPVAREWKRDGKKFVVKFDHAEGLKAKGSALEGFAIAGEDKQFTWGRARIQGDTVVVTHPDIDEPAAVRYNWGNSPDGNLYNAANLPAVPFRTDKWERAE